MSKNIDQIFIANPITTNAPTDLMYFGQSPYGPGNDAAMLFSSFVAQFQSPWIPGTGTNSAVGGDGTCTAAGNFSLVYGDTGSTSASSANEAFVLGTGCTANTPYSITMGFQCQTQFPFGYAAFAWGNQCTTGQAACWSIGAFNSVFSAFSFAFGQSITITGPGYSFGFGLGVTIHNDHCVCIGNSLTVNNTGSWVLGDSNPGTQTDNAPDQFVIGFNGGYFFYVATAGTATLAASIDPAGNLVNAQGTADQSLSVQTPSTGFSITIANNSKTLILDPAGTLATGTIIMPASPINGQEVRVSGSQTVTALTVSANAGQTISNAPTTLLAGTGFAYIFNLSNTNWYRIY